MAYPGGTYGGNSAFGGYPGGYNQNPAGNFAQGSGGLGSGYPVTTIGTNLPHVDPNNFPGTVHFGPSTTTIGGQPVGQFSAGQQLGQFPSGPGYFNPNVGPGGASGFNTGY